MDHPSFLESTEQVIRASSTLLERLDQGLRRTHSALIRCHRNIEESHAALRHAAGWTSEEPDDNE